MKKPLTWCVGLIAVSALIFGGCQKDDTSNPEMYTLEVMASDGGSVTVEVDGVVVENLSKVAAGRKVKLTPAPDDTGNKEFYEWVTVTGDVFVSGHDNTFYMPAGDVRIEGIFGDRRDDPNRPVYTLDVVTSGGGSVQVEAGGVVVENLSQVGVGLIVKLTPMPDSGKEFYEWETVAGDAYVSRYDNTFYMPAGDVKIEGVFGDERFEVRVNGGTPSVPVAAEGQQVMLQAALPQGYTLTYWLVESGDVNVDRETGIFTMPAADVEVTAVYMATPTAPYLLYYDYGQGNLALGTWTKQVSQANILYTKFGGTVAFTHTAVGDADTWSLDDILFSTVEDLTTLTNWGGWSGYSTDDNNAGLAIAPGEGGIHNDEFFPVGKGDICRLAGLTGELARRLMAEGKLDEYESGYRLPTFFELEPIYGDANQISTMNPNFQWTFDPAPGSWLADDKTVASLIPACAFMQSTDGLIFPSGSTTLNRCGAFWTSTPRTSTNGYTLESERGQSTGVGGYNGLYRRPYNTGCTVRCVPLDFGA